MRSFHVVALFVVVFLIMAMPGPSRAAGNVLVPTEKDNSSSDDNAANPDDDNSSSTDQSQTTAPVVPAVPAAPQAAPAMPKTVPGAASAPGSPTASRPTPPSAAVSVPPLPPAPKVPTNVIKITPPTKDMAAAWEKKLPNAISIGFTDGATIGSRDTGIIKSRLGIPENAIKDTCSLVLNGRVRTDKSAYVPHVNAFSSRLAIKYDGKIKNASINIMAACAKTTLPANAGSIIQYGDKDLVVLASVLCPAPDQIAKQLAISYTGDGKGQCVYQ